MQKMVTEKTVKELAENKPQCPKCGGVVVYYRKRTDDYLCRRCGELFPKK